MNIFKVIYSYLYYQFARISYHLVSKNDNKEAIYYKRKKSEYLIAVKDAKIGKKLYEVVKALKAEGGTTLINNLNARLKFSDYGLTSRNTVKWFCVSGSISRNWNYTSKLDKIVWLQKFVNAMQVKGFVLDDTRFECSKCNSVSEFLSFFIQSREEDKIKKSKECMIQLTHYVLSNGRTIDEIYESLINNGVCEGYRIPYKSSIAKMCYDYFKTGVTPDNILDVLHQEYYLEGYDNYSLIVLPNKLESKFKVTEKTTDYTIYDGCLKVYHNISEDYQKFLADYSLILESGIATLEQITAIIVDIDNHIIGYKFEKQDRQSVQEVLDTAFARQNDIFAYIAKLVECLKKYRGYSRIRFSNVAKSNNFGIEKDIVYHHQKHVFRCNTVQDLFNLTTNDFEGVKKLVTELFFKILANYMAKTYGELTSKAQFLEKVEVRFLSPIVANEFMNFALGNSVNYKNAAEELLNLLKNRMQSSDESISYDLRFCYDPLTTAITFDYEAISRYNVTLGKGTTEIMPNGRRVVTLKRSQNISIFKNKSESMRQSVRSMLGHIEDEHVKFAEVSEIIVGTQRLNSDNMYNVVGYILEPFRGEQLTDDVLLNLSNKDLLKVAAYLFIKFEHYHIPWNNIWMDNNFVFYINYMNENFEVKENLKENISEYVQYVFDYLVGKGYNPNAFVGWKLADNKQVSTMEYLLSLSDSFDEYCDEHKIYYDSKYGQCPVCGQTKYLLPQNFNETYTKVFEDSVAVHYNIDENYNLKVYKPCYKDMAYANVSRLISLRLSYDVDFHQDCFIPCKLALNSNNQFIGCIYETVKFEATDGNTSDVCVELSDSKLENLLRLKSLIRLILQIDEMTKNKNLTFIANPFSHVFLNRSHKRQVQILNIEFMCFHNSNESRKMKKWAFDYIRKVLQSDPTIEISNKTYLIGTSTSIFLESFGGMNKFLAELMELSKQMNKYCAVHKMHYKGSHVYCPKCIDSGMLDRNVLHINKSEFEGKTPDNEGGEAFIYLGSNGIATKVFKADKVNKNFKNTVLFAILSKKEILEKINRENHKYKYVIPQKLLVDHTSNEIFAYTMNWVENAFPISMLRDKNEIQKLGLSQKDILEIIITIGEGIANLHESANIYIGDLNGRNILFDVQKNVYFLDFDGMGVDEISPEFCTDGYIDPLSKKNKKITMKDDWYSFAVQAFYYLTYTHPFNGIYYEEVNGNKVLLEIPDKMERRISLLGNHGLKAPAIAVPWDWMSEELKSAFLNIFEGDYRESIVPQLKKQYQTLFANSETPNNAYRINPKFIATELNPFDGEVVKVFNPYAAVCKKENNYYIAVLIKSDMQVIQKNIYITNPQDIVECILSEDGKILFQVWNEYQIFAYDLEKKQTIVRSIDRTGAMRAVVNDRTIYFSRAFDGTSVIFKKTISQAGRVEKETMIVGKQKVKWFDVKFNQKFILIKQATENMDEVYCNSEKIFAFEYTSAEIAKQVKYNIVYDNATKSWLVINNFGKGIVIHMSGGSTEIDISTYVNDVNFANIYFEKGNIYIPSKECMYIVNVEKNMAKIMECRKIMAPESKVYDVNSKGFNVITNNVFYEVRKG